jgi:hypothetical protein
MARLTLQELRDLVRKHTDWNAKGWQSPDSVLDLDLKKASAGDSRVLDVALSKKTLTYEGREVTVVLDFDEQGYLVGLEFV